MMVSTKHLILASATFRECLGSDDFYEDRTLQKQSYAAMVLSDEDEDPDTIAISLYIIHGITRNVPCQVSMKLLTRIASVVIHRQMHEAVEYFSDSWIENLKRNPLPRIYGPEVLSWLFVFWVFQKEDDFRSMSQSLERKSDHDLEDQADAVPPCRGFHNQCVSSLKLMRKSSLAICQEIFSKRVYSSIESAIQIIYDPISKYSCHSMVLGSLLKSSAVIGISPRPKSPYPGMPFKTLAAKTEK